MTRPLTALFSASLTALTALTAVADTVPLSDTWTFFDPEGNSSLTNQSATGFDATISDVIPGGGNAVRPRVYQVHNAVDLSAIGAAYSCVFDLELDTPIFDSNRGDLHFYWGDTVANSEFLAVIHLGPNPDRDDAIKMRLDNTAFNPAPDAENPAEGPLGSGGNSWPIEAHFPQPSGDSEDFNRLDSTDAVHRFSFNLVRVSTTQLAFLLKWQIVSSTNDNQIAGDGTELYTLLYDETTGYIEGRQSPTGTDRASDAWGVDAAALRDTPAGTAAPGAVSQINFCGFMLHDDDPFNQDGTNATVDSGVLKFRNWEVACRNLFEECQSLTEVSRDPISNGVIVRWKSFQDDSLDGSRYTVIRDGKLSNLAGGGIIGSNLGADSSGDSDYLDVFPAPGTQFYRVELEPRPPAD